MVLRNTLRDVFPSHANEQERERAGIEAPLETGLTSC